MAGFCFLLGSIIWESLRTERRASGTQWLLNILALSWIVCCSTADTGDGSSWPPQPQLWQQPRLREERKKRAKGVPPSRKKQGETFAVITVMHVVSATHTHTLLSRLSNQKLPNKMVSIHEHQDVSERHLIKAFPEHGGRSLHSIWCPVRTRAISI